MKIEKRKRNIKNKSDCGETNYSKNFYSIFTRTIWHQIYFNFSQIKYLLSKKLRDRIKNRNAFDKNRMLLIKITISLEELNLILSLQKNFHSNLYEIGSSMLNIIIIMFNRN